ncbi:Lrp/AsnC family transcriptional regulator [Marinobacter sp. 1Y8]
MRFKDEVDRKIIEVLKVNAREKISDIARRVNRSRTAVEKRIGRLETDGIIKGYNVVVASEHEDKEKLHGFVIIKHVEGSQCEELLSDASEFDIIKRKFSVYGDLDLVIEIEYNSLEDMMDFKYFLTNHPKVKSVIVAPVIKEWG